MLPDPQILCTWHNMLINVNSVNRASMHYTHPHPMTLQLICEGVLVHSKWGLCVVANLVVIFLAGQRSFSREQCISMDGHREAMHYTSRSVTKAPDPATESTGQGN